MINGFLKRAVVGLAISILVLLIFTIPLGVLALLRHFGAPEIVEPIIFFMTAIITICGLCGFLIAYTDGKDEKGPWI